MLAPAHPEITAYARPRAPFASLRPARSPGRAQKWAAAVAAAMCVWTVYADPLARNGALQAWRPLQNLVIPAASAVKFGAASARRVMLDGQPILYVEGSLRNAGPRTLKTPTLVVTLVGDDGQPLYAWKTKPAVGELRPSQEIGYQTRLASPPEKFNRIAVSLADGR